MMTQTQIDALSILKLCTFLPGSTAKKFVHQMSSLSDKEGYELSEKQVNYLWKLVYMYRKQHKNKWFTTHAENMQKIETRQTF